MRCKAKSLVLLLFLSALSSCKKETAKPAEHQSGSFLRDGAEINYNIYGNGGSTLLFVHGSYIDQTYWAEQVKYFKNDYKVVTLDLAGHGKSGKGRKYWSIDGFAADVYGLIKRQNLKNVILIGHSMGGDVNLIEATAHPKNIIGFIGIDNFKNAASPLPKKFDKDIRRMKSALQKDVAGTNEKYARTMLVSAKTDSAITERVANDFRNAYPPMAKDLTPEFFAIYKRERRLLPKIRLKMHLINVANVPTNEDPLKKYCSSGYDLREMNGTCHYPMLENPKELNRLLRETIEEISRENDAVKRL